MNIDDIISSYNALRAVRDGSFLPVWKRVRKYVYPDRQSDKSAGSVEADIFDTTAIMARERLAAGMYNWMAPPDKRWFELQPQDELLADNEEVKNYFAEVTKKIAMTMANSNWATVLIEVLNELAAGFDGVIYLEDGGESVLNFRCLVVESVCYSANSKQVVDTLYHELKMSAVDIVREFEHVPEKIRQAAEDPKRRTEEFSILHAVMPRYDFVQSAGNKSMPFADYYIELGSKAMLREGGFNEFPYAVCHFRKAPQEAYGRGPGVDILPDIIMLNRMRQTYIVNAEHAADPSWLVPDGTLVSGSFDRSPGAVNIYKPDMNNARPELVPHVNNAHNAYADIQAEQERIRKDGFYADIFDPLGDLKQLTATEAEIRNSAKMIPFAPIAGNLHSQLFRPIINRVYSLLNGKGLLPQLPAVLLEKPDYKIEFVSKIALSIKNIETLAWLQTEASLVNIAQVRPEVLDNFDFDEIARQTALNNGINPAWLINTDDRDSMREDRAVQQAQAQGAGTLMEAAGALGNNLNKAPEAGSPLDMVLNGGAWYEVG